LQEFASVVLKCPKCDGRLEISSEMSDFACGSCGANVTVQRRGGTVSLSLAEASEGAPASTDETAAEAALRRLTEELAKAETDRIDVERATAASVVEREAAIARSFGRKADRNLVVGLFVVTMIVFTIVVKAFKSLEGASLVIGIVLAVIVTISAGMLLVRARTGQVQRLKREIEKVRRKGMEDLASVDARIEDIRTRLAKIPITSTSPRRS
jgi:hypothetical protein